MRPKQPAACVVDTNVGVVANGRSSAGAACRQTCAARLDTIVDGGHVVIDNGFALLREYIRHLNTPGQPGPGHRFLRWLLANQGNTSRCTQVKITPAVDGTYLEFPDHPDLAGFDPADRKFIAIAAAHPERPCVLQAFDSKWWGYRHGFAECGIKVTFLCPEEIRAKYEQKFGRRCS